MYNKCASINVDLNIPIKEVLNAHLMRTILVLNAHSKVPIFYNKIILLKSYYDYPICIYINLCDFLRIENTCLMCSTNKA